MGRIGLLTYHHAVNIGSVLQTLGAWRLLSRLRPRDRVEIIDYYPADARRFNDHQGAAGSWRDHWLPNEWKKAARCYQGFLRHHCLFSPFALTTDDLTTAWRRIAERNYDAIVVGSDTVFQIDGYFGTLVAGPKAPNIYYLAGLSHSCKIGLAVSFDPLLTKHLQGEKRSRLADALKDFSAILYRDETAHQALLELGVDQQCLAYCPDPTIMVDVADLAFDEEWAASPSTDKVGISIGDYALKEKVVDCFRQRGMEVVDVMQPPLPSSSRWHRGDNSIARRLQVYRGLSGLITDRFHGSILALKLGSYPIVGVENKAKYLDANSKLRDLYQRLDLHERFLTCDALSFAPEELWQVWEAPMPTKVEVLARFERLRYEGMMSLARLLPGV